MNKAYIVKVTSQAEDQIHEIIYYITHELKAPYAALQITAVIYGKRVQLPQLSQMDME